MTTWPLRPGPRPPRRRRAALPPRLRRPRRNKERAALCLTWGSVLESNAMKLFSLTTRPLVAGACGLFLSGAALAQQAPETGARPEVKQVGDWAVRCFPIQSPSPCDVFQEQDYQK